MDKPNSYESVSKRVKWIVAFFSASLGGILLLTYLMFELLSSTRAFTGYHSLWTHTQNQALIHLVSYANSGDLDDFYYFEENLSIMDGIQNALYELNMDSPNSQIVESNLLSSSLYVEDIQRKIQHLHFLRTFTNFRTAFDSWERYHQNSQKLREIANDIRFKKEANELTNSDLSELHSLSQNLNVMLVDDQINLLNNLDEASSNIKRYSIITLILPSTGIFFVGGVMINQWYKSFRSLQRVSKERDRVASFPELNPSPIVVVNSEGEYSYLNESATILLSESGTDGNEPVHSIHDKLQIHTNRMLRENRASNTFEVDHNGEHYLVYGFQIEHESSIHYYFIDITELNNLEIRLQKSLEEKTLLLSEVHHRVKNNLAVAIGLLEIESFDNQNPHTESIIKRNVARLHSIASIHKLLYEEESLTHIQLSSYFHSLVDSFCTQYSGIDINLSISSNCNEETININQAVPNAMLMNELISTVCPRSPKGKNEKTDITLTCVDDFVTVTIQFPNIDQQLSQYELKQNSLIKLISKQLGAENLSIFAGSNDITYSFKLSNLKGSSSSLPKNYKPSDHAIY